MPRRRSHSRRASAGRSSTCGWNATRKSLPSPWCLVSVERSCACTASTTGSASATGSASMSIQRMRGSRRNHRSWRTANWRVRGDDRRRRPRRASIARRGGRAAPCSRAPGGGARDRPPARERLDLVDKPGVDHRGARAAAIRAVSSGRGQRSPNWTNGDRRVGVEARAERAERAAAADASPRAPARRGGGWSAPSARRPTGSSVGELAVQRRDALVGASRVELGADLRPPARHSSRSMTLRRYRPVPATRTARCRARRCRRALACAASAKSATVKSSAASTRSMQWCGTAARSAASAWRCRCPSAGRPASSRRRRSRRRRCGAATRHRDVGLARRGRPEDDERRRRAGHAGEHGDAHACAAARRAPRRSRPTRWCGAASVISTVAYAPGAQRRAAA